MIPPQNANYFISHFFNNAIINHTVKLHMPVHCLPTVHYPLQPHFFF